MEHKLLSPPQLMDALGVSRSTINRWMQKGVIAPAFRAGNGLRWDLQDVIEKVNTYGERATLRKELKRRRTIMEKEASHD